MIDKPPCLLTLEERLALYAPERHGGEVIETESYLGAEIFQIDIEIKLKIS